MTFNKKIFWFQKFWLSSSLLFSLKIVIIKSTHSNRKYLRFHYIVLCYCHIEPPPNNPENAISFSLRKPSSFPDPLMSKLGEVFSMVTHSLLVNNDNLLKFLIQVVSISRKFWSRILVISAVQYPKLRIISNLSWCWKLWSVV